MAEGPKLFNCPKCRHTYLGHDPLPDCPSCGYDYRERAGFRWDLVVYLFAILGLLSFLLVSSFYRNQLGYRSIGAQQETSGQYDDDDAPSSQQLAPASRR